MERMLVAVFDNQNKAYAALRALESLDNDGFIAMYDSAIVTKDSSGAAMSATERYGVPEGTLGGIAVGSLLGALGGPVGLAAGAASGFILGATTDFLRSRIGSDFIEDVRKAILPGNSAVVAEIDEETTSRVDDQMEALGGFVYRRALSEVADTAYEQEVAAIEADLAQTKAEHAASRTDRRGRLEARIDALNEKLRHALDHAKARRAALQHDAARKVEHLQAQAVDARYDIKAKQAQRVDAVRRRYKQWLDSNRHAN
jgi:uncharacterized membrane protein